MTLNKLKSSLKKLASDELNANELAKYMQIPARSARRILTTLEEKGFAEVVAEENPTHADVHGRFIKFLHSKRESIITWTLISYC